MASSGLNPELQGEEDASAAQRCITILRVLACSVVLVQFDGPCLSLQCTVAYRGSGCTAFERTVIGRGFQRVTLKESPTSILGDSVGIPVTFRQIPTTVAPPDFRER